jgi:hypothetical protein
LNRGQSIPRRIPRRGKELQAQDRAIVAGHEDLNSAIEVQLQCKTGLGIARLAAVSHSIASAQSQVATLHHIVHELLVFLVVPVAIEAPASIDGGGVRT